jgi:hypothetical protein
MGRAHDAIQLVGNPVTHADVPVKRVSVFTIAAQMWYSNKLCHLLHPSDFSMSGPDGRVSITGHRRS